MKNLIIVNWSNVNFCGILLLRFEHFSVWWMCSTVTTLSFTSMQCPTYQVSMSFSLHNVTHGCPISFVSSSSMLLVIWFWLLFCRTCYASLFFGSVVIDVDSPFNRIQRLLNVSSWVILLSLNRDRAAICSEWWVCLQYVSSVLTIFSTESGCWDRINSNSSTLMAGTFQVLHQTSSLWTYWLWFLAFSIFCWTLRLCNSFCSSIHLYS